MKSATGEKIITTKKEITWAEKKIEILTGESSKMTEKVAL